MGTRRRLAVLAALLASLFTSVVGHGVGAFAADDAAVGEFKKAWAAAKDDEGRTRAVDKLAQGGTVECARTLVRLAVDPAAAWQVHDAAVTALHGLTQPAVVLWAGEAAAGKKAEKEPAQRAVVCDFLAARARGGDAGAARLLLPALKDAHWSVRAAAVRGVTPLRTPDVVDALVLCLASSDPRIASDITRALEELTARRFATTLEWTSWWEGNRSGYTLPAAGTPVEGAEGGASERTRTVTRLEPPSSTMYRTQDSSRMLFVVDVSYSMQVKVVVASDGQNLTRLEYVKRSLVRTIDEQLDDDDRFNLMSFSDGPKLWRKDLARGDSASKKKAIGWVEALALEGDTNYSDTLEAAFKVPEIDTIWFLTDGTPTAGRTTIGTEILGSVRKWNGGRNVRVNTIGFFAGDAASFNVVEDKGSARRLLGDLAAQNGGTFTFYE